MFLTYEFTTVIDGIESILKKRLDDGEFVIKRRPYRWHKDDKVISNAYEGQSLETVCEDRKWEIIHNFHHIAVVKEIGFDDRDMEND